MELGNGNNRRTETASPEEVERWMREFGTELLQVIYLYLGDYHTAEDVFQEVFCKAYRSYGSFRGESSVKTWLLRIAINACKDYRKSAWRRRVLPISEELEQTLSAADEYEQVEQRVDAEKVTEAVQALPKHYKEVVLCCCYQELSLEETAKLLGLPVGTVKSRLSRARELLRKQKGGIGFEI